MGLDRRGGLARAAAEHAARVRLALEQGEELPRCARDIVDRQFAGLDAPLEQLGERVVDALRTGFPEQLREGRTSLSPKWL